MMRLIKIASLAVLVLGLFACSGNKYEGKIIALSTQAGLESLEGARLEGARLEGARLVLLDPEKPEKRAETLFDHFHSAASPALSHDARYLVFSGKENEDDLWQIWVADLRKNQLSQVTNLEENCSYPAFLPDMNVIFSRDSEYGGIATGDLWKCGMDGCCLTQLSHNPAYNIHSSVLWEGRILFVGSQQYPEARDPQLMVMKPDGVKSELYSPGNGDLKPVSKGLEGPDGWIYFISTGGKLSRVLHHRPLHTFELLARDVDGSFAAAQPCADSTLLVSYKAAGENNYRICSFNPSADANPVVLFAGEKDLLNPLPVRKVDPRPRILPSAVNPEYPTGLIMVQNINHSSIVVNEGISGDSMACCIRVSTIEGELGVVEAKDDGSVYFKLDADMPFRMETLNSQGEVLRGPSDWIYLRPAERRACTGCHVNPELAPRNYQPHAVKEDPVVLVQHEMETR